MRAGEDGKTNFMLLDSVEEKGKEIIYGAGVDILINSKNWKDASDLGNIYTTWGGHAYGRKVHGMKVKEAFASRLAVADVSGHRRQYRGNDLRRDNFCRR